MAPRNLKYVMFSGGFPVLLPPSMHHADARHGNLIPASAGLTRVYFDDRGVLQVDCFGESCGLKLTSMGEADEEIIRRAFVGDQAPKYLVTPSGEVAAMDGRLSRRALPVRIFTGGTFRLCHNPPDGLRALCWSDNKQIPCDPEGDASLLGLLFQSPVI